VGYPPGLSINFPGGTGHKKGKNARCDKTKAEAEQIAKPFWLVMCDVRLYALQLP
jgi:hypothetical protein